MLRFEFLRNRIKVRGGSGKMQIMKQIIVSQYESTSSLIPNRVIRCASVRLHLSLFSIMPLLSLNLGSLWFSKSVFTFWIYQLCAPYSSIINNWWQSKGGNTLNFLISSYSVHVWRVQLFYNTVNRPKCIQNIFIFIGKGIELARKHGELYFISNV